MRIFLTEFRLDGVLYDGPQLLADSRHEAQLMAEDSGLIIVDEIKDMVLTEAGLETLH